MKNIFGKSLILSGLLTFSQIPGSIAQENSVNTIVRSTKTDVFDNFTRIDDPTLQSFVTRIQEYKTQEIELLSTKDTMENQGAIDAIISLHNNFDALQSEASSIAEGMFLATTEDIQSTEMSKKHIQSLCKKRKYSTVFSDIMHDGKHNPIVAIPHIVGHRDQPVVRIYDAQEHQYYNLEVVSLGGTTTITFRTTREPRDPLATSEPTLIHCEKYGTIGGEGVDIVNYPAVSLCTFLETLDMLMEYNALQKKAIADRISALEK